MSEPKDTIGLPVPSQSGPLPPQALSLWVLMALCATCPSIPFPLKCVQVEPVSASCCVEAGVSSALRTDQEKAALSELMPQSLHFLFSSQARSSRQQILTETSSSKPYPVLGIRDRGPALNKPFEARGREFA